MSMDPQDCLTRFEGHGIRFDYPGYWELSVESDGSDTILTVAADGTCFWSLRVLLECPRTDDVLKSCIDAFQEEYDDTEVLSANRTFAEMPAAVRELSFSCFELLNSAVLTCVRSSSMTLLCWWQGTDHELEAVEPLFQQMTESVRIMALLPDEHRH